jgi:hypothetical protein
MGWSGRAPAPPGDDAGGGALNLRSTPMPCTQTTLALTLALVGHRHRQEPFHVVGLDRRGKRSAVECCTERAS